MRGIITIWLLLAFSSCTDDNLLLPQGKELVVVEGWITDQSTVHWVKLSRTTSFYSANPEIMITDATVAIEEQSTESQYPLGYDATSKRYLSDEFAGIQGRNYRLRIQLANGSELLSEWELLQPVPAIDLIEFENFEDTDPETGEDIIVYYPVVVSNDPVENANHYRYKGYRNGILMNTPEELVLLSDQFNNGQELEHNIPAFRLALTDEIRIELHSLTHNAYQFLDLIKTQTTSLGSSSGTAPAKLVGNLRYLDNVNNEIVLGFFGASSVQSATAIVSE